MEGVIRFYANIYLRKKGAGTSIPGKLDLRDIMNNDFTLILADGNRDHIQDQVKNVRQIKQMASWHYHECFNQA